MFSTGSPVLDDHRGIGAFSPSPIVPATPLVTKPAQLRTQLVGRPGDGDDLAGQVLDPRLVFAVAVPQNPGGLQPAASDILEPVLVARLFPIHAVLLHIPLVDKMPLSRPEIQDFDEPTPTAGPGLWHDRHLVAPPSDRPAAVDDLFQLVNDDPFRAVAAAGELASGAIAVADHRLAAAALRGRGLANDYLLEGTAAVADLNRALVHAELTGDPQVIGEVQMTRAGVLVHAGDNRAAETAIDVAVGLLTEVPLARAMVQRGAMRTAVGSLDPALEDFATAERMLEAADDDLWRAHLGVNRAIVLAYKGDYARSRDEFEDARRRYTALGHRQSVAEIAQNLGWLAARSGDLAAAFRHFDRAEAEYRAIDAGLGYLWIHRCWALLACHLAAEARALARRCSTAPPRRRSRWPARHGRCSRSRVVLPGRPTPPTSPCGPASTWGTSVPRT